jgi:hypothetical protein
MTHHTKFNWQVKDCFVRCKVCGKGKPSSEVVTRFNKICRKVVKECRDCQVKK